MEPVALRWNNFRGFVDSGPFEVRPITLVIGANNTGKTSLLTPLLLMKQTLGARDRSVGLVTNGDLVNAGIYEDLIHNHSTRRRLTFGVDFLSPLSISAKRAPPQSCRFTFIQAPDPKTTQLFRYDVYDAAGRRVLSRARLASGNFSLPGFSQRRGRPRSDADAVTNAIRRDKPDHFLFSTRGLVSVLLDQALSHLGQQPETTEDVPVVLPDLGVYYSNYVTAIEGAMRELLSAINYIGPIRERPLRFYPISGETPRNVGSRGEYAPEVLYRLDDAETKKQINRWLNQFGLGRSYTFSELGMEAFSLLFERKPGLPVNISDTGFGVSQVMPFIVQTAVEEPTLLITEQPEIHLNPRLQSLLADLFLDLAERRHYVLAETHSEHLVLRLRRLIAEGQIASSRVALYYVAWNEGESEVRRVPIDDSGYIDPADWPSGFFDESLSQAVGLAAAQRGRAKNAR